MENFLRNKTIKDIRIGDEATYSKTIREADVHLFVKLTGDLAPQHLNEKYAMSTRYSKRIVHGMLTASLTGAPLSKLVAPGGVTVEHNFRFKAPVFIGDTVTAIAKVVEKNVQRKLVKVELRCVNQKGEIVVEGWGIELMAIGREIK